MNEWNDNTHANQVLRDPATSHASRHLPLTRREQRPHCSMRQAAFSGRASAVQQLLADLSAPERLLLIDDADREDGLRGGGLVHSLTRAQAAVSPAPAGATAGRSASAPSRAGALDSGAPSRASARLRAAHAPPAHLASQAGLYELDGGSHGAQPAGLPKGRGRRPSPA